MRSRRTLITALCACLLAFAVAPSALASTYTIAADGLPHTVKSTVADENITVKFAGTAGQRVSLNMTGVTIGTSTCCSSLVSVRKPDGTNLVAPFSVGTRGRFLDVRTLPVSGTYKIFIDPQGTAKGAMTLTLYNVPADDSKALTVGGPSDSLTTTVPGQNANATFTGSPGQRVSLQLSSASFGTSPTAGAKVSILNPDGTVLAAPASFGTNGSFVDTKTLATAGTYKIRIDPVQTNVGSVTLTLFNVPADASSPITAGGSPVTLTTSVAGQNAGATFSATAGARVAVEATNETYGFSACCDAKLSLVGPGGTVVAPVNLGTAGAFLDTATLSTTGTYTVVVDPQGMGVGSVDLRLISVPPDVTASLVFGQALPVSTTAAGQNARLTFSGTLNQRISLDLSSVALSGCDVCSAKVSILKPGGTLLAPRMFTTLGTFVDPLTLPATGTYTVVLDPQTTATVDATLTLYSVPADPSYTIAANGASRTPSTTVPGQNATLTFSGTAGQRISLGMTNVSLAGNCCARVTIYRPDNNMLAPPMTVNTSDPSNAWFLEPRTLATTGTYKIVVDPQRSAVGSMTINLYSVPADVTKPITAGGAGVSVTLTPGQNGYLTFSGTAGQRVSVALSGVTFPDPSCCSLNILKPDGSVVNADALLFGGQATDFLEPKTLPVTGTYKLKIDPFKAAAGTAVFNLYTVPADATGSIGNPGSAGATITAPGQKARLAFTGTQNQLLTITASNVTIGPSATDSTTVSVEDASGTAWGFLTVGTAGGSTQVSLPADGQYYLVVDPSGASTGSLTLTLS